MSKRELTMLEKAKAAAKTKLVMHDTTDTSNESVELAVAHARGEITDSQAGTARASAGHASLMRTKTFTVLKRACADGRVTISFKKGK